MSASFLHLVSCRAKHFVWSGLLLLAAPVFAQHTTASLAGTVTDPSGASVPEAKIRIENSRTGFSQDTATDVNGAFLFPQLPVGSYRLTVERTGFLSHVQEGIGLTVNKSATVDVRLQVGALTERVVVNADASLVNLREAATGQLIDQKRIVDLPLNGRTPQALLYLAAGTIDFGRNAAALGGANWYVTPSVNGSGWGQVNFQMDGASNNDTFHNQNQPFPNPDAVQEFNLQAGNFTAEYGNAAGGIVNVVTKSGTNEIHGSVFEFLRNGDLNARNFFALSQDTLKRNQFGGAAGGPVVRDRLFYFLTYQGTRDRSDPAGRIAFVPTTAERQGDFSSSATTINDPLTRQPFPGNRIPANRISAASQFFLRSIPLPNRSGREMNFTATKVALGNDQGMAKIDYNRGKSQIAGRYFADDYKRPPETAGANLLAADEAGEVARAQSASGIYTYTLSPTLLSTTTFGFTRWRGGSLSSAPFNFRDAGVKIASSRDSALAIQPNRLTVLVTGMRISTGHFGEFNRDDFTFRQAITKIKGSHELRIGGEIVRVKNNLNNTFQMDGGFNITGQITGDALADFMIGRAASFSQGGGEFKNLSGARYALYIQDNWRVGRRLTLNLGLRWDPYLPPYDHDGRVVCFDLGVKSRRYANAPAGLIYGGPNPDNGCPTRGAEANLGNIGPRVGFAYRLTQDGKTALRGGIGYYYSPPPTVQTNSFSNVAPFSPQFTLNDVSLEDPWGSAGIANPFPQQYGPRLPGPEAVFTFPTSLTYLQKDFHAPLLTTWNFALERQVASWLARAAYIGNKGTFLWAPFRGSRQVNAAIYVPGQSTLANIQARRPLRDFASVAAIETAHNSNYHALQLVAEKRFGKGFSILANHTWSKQLDDFGWTNPFNRSFDYGPARDDVRQNFKFSNVWEIPRLSVRGTAGRLLNGWSLNAILVWQSGLPFTVSSGRDNAFSGTGGQRADYLVLLR